MAIRTIRIYGDDLLRKKCRVVDDINQRISILIEDMKETMYNSNGIGLAAPQVGILKRIVVIDVGDGLITLINPEIVEMQGSQLESEGCLSIPGVQKSVNRPETVKVKAINEIGEKIIIDGEGLLARALCHEIDHLDGVLFIDKAIEDEEK
ncbi:peptide deformylase [Clostridium psychrophilum]|uniref:peptide deformylase n=1 Tax=Clostridium psychrophilum TaxID=132926 RepID=UPI001C0B6DCB|nr:peptide deformylase [Clostridium psychrophilum]MBU3180416.1 peptide deformylase [Clostridium psychrophilum]